MKFDWKEEGFASPPTPTVACGDEKLYRASDGSERRKWGNRDRPGVCFSLDKASSRWHAEMLYSVMEYHNSVTHITEFSIPANTPMWIGKVDPGDPRALLGGVSGNQVFIEQCYVKSLEEVSTAALPDDLKPHHVVTGRSPRFHS